MKIIRINNSDKGRATGLNRMEGCDSLELEMADLEGFQCVSPSAIDQDDEDEVEELRNRCLICLHGLMMWSSLAVNNYYSFF